MTYVNRTANTATNRLSVSAYWQNGSPLHLRVTGYAADTDAARAFAARFPKGCKLRGEGLSGHPEFAGYVSVFIRLAADGANGGRNETGIRRYRSIQRAAAQLGVELVWDGSGASNAYPTSDEFEAAIA